MNAIEPKAVIIVPLDWWERYKRMQSARRRALLQEVRAIEAELDIVPRLQAVCPTCQRTRAKKAG